MRHPSEHFAVDNLPTPNQLHELTAVGFGVDKKLKRVSQQAATGDYYILNALESDVELGDETDGLRSMRHTVGMRLNERSIGVGSQWNLKYYDSLHLPVHAREPFRPASATVRYEFQWNEQRTVFARRMGKVVSMNSFGELVDNLYTGRPDYGEDERRILAAEVGFRAVTAEETAALIAEAADYYEKVSLLSR